jgi:hypothetical protein
MVRSHASWSICGNTIKEAKVLAATRIANTGATVAEFAALPVSSNIIGCA